MPVFDSGALLEGMRTRWQSPETRPPFASGPYETYQFAKGFRILGTARDTSHTGLTHVLRPGTIMARTSSGERVLTVYDPTSDDPWERVPVGVLATMLRMTDYDGNNIQAGSAVITKGVVDPSKLYNFDQNARRALKSAGISFIDDVADGEISYPRVSVAKTANYTIEEDDYNLEFTNSGASGQIQLTLPVIAGDAGKPNNGFTVWVRVIAAQNIVITAAASGEMVTLGNAAATSVTIGTIGQVVRLTSRSGKWYYEDFSPIPTEQTVAVSTLSGSSESGEVVQRIGGSTTEGLETKVLEEEVDLTSAGAVFVNLTNTIPVGAVLLSVQANLETAVTGATSSNLAKIGIGPSGNPDQYGITAALTQNSKIDTIPDWAVIASSPLQLRVNGCQTDGSASTDNLASGTVRVRIVYFQLNSLDNAA